MLFRIGHWLMWIPDAFRDAAQRERTTRWWWTVAVVAMTGAAAVWALGLNSRIITDPVDLANRLGVLVAALAASLTLHLVLGPTRSRPLSHLLLTADTLATTALVWVTGGSGSPFAVFYVVIGIVAGVLHGQTTMIGYLLLAAGCNATVVALDYFGSSRPSPAGLPIIVMVASMALLVALVLMIAKYTIQGRYLETLYGNVCDGLFLLDADGQILDVNGVAEQLMGGPRESLVGRRIQALSGDRGDDVDLRGHLARCVAGERVRFEVELQRADRTRVPVEIAAQRVEGLSPVRVQAFARDISARRILEEQIRQQNVELRRINQELQVGRDLALDASRMKSRFLANMSHELRTPLNSIIGYTQFVLQDREHPVTREQIDDLQRVLNAGRHLLELINGLLDLARIESGRERVTVSRFSLGDLIASVVAAVAPMAVEKRIELLQSVDPELPLLHSDENKLRQTLLNLLANAVKFTDQGHVRVLAYRDGTDRVGIDVVDTGIGIPHEHLDELFTEFHQIDPAIHKKYGGTGLGLAIVKRLVELLQGSIRVESSAGAGSSFRVVIPIELSQAGEPDAEMAQTAAPFDPPEHGTVGLDTPDRGAGSVVSIMAPSEVTSTVPDGPPRGAVLVIDDERDSRLLLARQLTEAGYRVYTAATGAQGLQLVQELQPDAVTLDLRLSGQWDGHQVLAALKTDERSRGIPVVVVSVAHHEATVGINGAAAALAKPLRPAELYETLQRLGVFPQPAVPAGTLDAASP